MRRVVTRDAIIHDRDAIAVHGHASAEAVTEQNADQRSARQLGHSLAVLGSGFPRCSQRLERRVHGHRLELESVAIVEIGELIGIMRLHRARPRPHPFIHVGQHRRRRMQREMLAEGGQRDP